MAIVNAFANLQKLLVEFHCFLIFFNVVIQDSDGVIRSALIPNFASPPAPEGQHFIIFEPPLNSYEGSVVNFVCIKSFIILGFINALWLLNEPAGCIEEEWQLNSVRHGRSHRFVIPRFIKIAYLVFLCERPTDPKRPVGTGCFVGALGFGSVHAWLNKNIIRQYN